ncbi:cytidine deaminase [Hyphococcus flavus]|uniref:Cytidine deaminase n=1 Tax=Hyphococcus flavus TaxID=1866326 RepID=A0AAE9Z9Y0_9PROT|nr:cytidine deaminase [Hyphococcus flavus]WDI30173.1 cytidine deaminase [Hyphococcus flavus]
MTCTDANLIEHAASVRERAYAPYSNFKVGAAIIDDKGNLHIGCNVENAAYPIGNCAEISAIASMIASGGSEIRKIAVVGGGETIEPCMPCGGCRQAIAEFSDDNTVVVIKNTDGSASSLTLNELLPHGFRLKS